MNRTRLAALVLSLAAACGARPGAPVFLWHSVGEGSGDRYDLDPQELERELSLLERYGAVTVGLDDLLDAYERKAALPARAVVLTFDDGRACLYAQALPLLLRHHMKAELFVVSSFLGEDAAHRISHRDDTGVHPYLTWPELTAMVVSGAFVAESHSRTHPRLPDLPWSAQLSEMRDSGRELRERLHAPVHFFAYPFGSSSLATRLLVGRAGYRAGISVDPRPGSFRQAVPRISIRRGAGDAFSRALERTFGPLPLGGSPGGG